MTNRLDNMTVDERNESAKMSNRRNYITEQCCSVDDLRSYLRNCHPADICAKQKVIIQLKDAIDYEKAYQNRVSIIKLLDAKRKAFKKSINSR